MGVHGLQASRLNNQLLGKGCRKPQIVADQHTIRGLNNSNRAWGILYFSYDKEPQNPPPINKAPYRSPLMDPLRLL